MPLTNRIKELRARKNLTQAQLAQRVGVTRQTILAIEMGHEMPSLELGMQIAGILGMSVEDVFAPSVPAEEATSDWDE